LTASSKLWLRSLTIHRYEQFRDCPRVEFSPDDNLILGVNGSGKTSLLRLLAAVLRWNYDALLGHPFKVEFEQVLDVGTDPPVSIKGRVQYQPDLRANQQQFPGQRIERSKYEGFEAQFDVCDGKNQTFSIKVLDSLLRVMQENLSAKSRPVESWLADAVDDELRSTSEPFLHLRERAMTTFAVHETNVDFAQFTEHIHYDFQLGYIVGPAVLLGGFGPASSIKDRQWFRLVYRIAIRAAEQDIRDDGRGVVDQLATLAQTSQWTVDSPDLGLDLHPLLAALAADRIILRLKIEKVENVAGDQTLEGRGVEIRVGFPSGMKVVDSRLTFGQKRLIAIGLGALICGGSPLLVDEIDNGLHPVLVEKTLEFIRGRQTFIASHNKLVVDLLDYESPEDMRRTIHVCRR
jgi:energy-coupling factor transporter ATP-binding protein EcfA2